MRTRWEHRALAHCSEPFLEREGQITEHSPGGSGGTHTAPCTSWTSPPLVALEDLSSLESIG
jgi:hypothetical protein